MTAHADAHASPSCATWRSARSRAPARTRGDGGDHGAQRLTDAEAQGLASHGVARIPQYAAHLRNGRADGGAVAVVARERGGAVLVDAALRARVSRPARSPWPRRSGARASSASLRRRHQQPSFRRRRVSPAAGRRRRDGRTGASGNSPAAMPAAGGKRAAVRHQSDRRRVSAARRRCRCRSTCRCRRSRAAR